MIELAKGTIEKLVVDVTDRLENLTTLDDKSPKFDIRPQFAETYIVTNASADSDGMRAECLVDTSDEDFVPGVYELYLHWDAFPEFPREGPLHFKVIS